MYKTIEDFKIKFNWRWEES